MTIEEKIYQQNPHELLRRIQEGYEGSTTESIELGALLGEILNISLPVKHIPAGTHFYRARTYWEDDVYVKYREGVKKDLAFQGFDAAGSFVNLHSSSAGRCNREEEPILYLSESIEASALEIGSKRNTAVSVAVIEAKEELKLLDLREGVNIASSNDIHKAEWLSEFKKELSTEMNFPNREYSLTQKISKYAKGKAYDGIMYHSTYHVDNLEKTDRGSINYAIFNYEKCEPISSKLYLVKNVDIQLEAFAEYES